LKKADLAKETTVKEKLFQDDAERALWSALQEISSQVAPLLQEREYTAALDQLATLRGVVDAFFDGVMVMDDNKAVRNNRLALLAELRTLFLGVADISRLAID
jgi:glycyl-tRNA synthetase beta chain